MLWLLCQAHACTLPTRTGWPSVGILWLDEIASFVFCFCVWNRVKLRRQVRSWNTLCLLLQLYMSKRTSLQRRVPEENSMPTMSASVKRRLSSERSQCQDHRVMTTTCCPGSIKSFWRGFAPDITDWTVICTANWSWHPHQLAPVVKKTKPQSTFYEDAPFTKLQEKMRGLSALPWWPNSTGTSRSWRRRRHSSPERSWSCRLRTPRRRRRPSTLP